MVQTVSMSKGGAPVTPKLAEEVPLSLTYNGVAAAVMMVSPFDLEDFVRGFSLTEGIIAKGEDLVELELAELDGGVLAKATLSDAAFADFSVRRRALPGGSSCGICGVIELEEALFALPEVSAPPPVSAEAIERAVAALRPLQIRNEGLGALHAAVWVSPEGEVMLVREDVGRHNALDKLIGALMMREPEVGFVLMSSRCSVELVQKAAMAGVSLLATVSAATTLAASRAEEAGLTLLARVGRWPFEIVCDPHGVFARESRS